MPTTERKTRETYPIWFETFGTVRRGGRRSQQQGVSLSYCRIRYLRDDRSYYCDSRNVM